MSASLMFPSTNTTARSYFTGSGEGIADIACELPVDVINENWTADGGEDYTRSTRECAETDVHIELTAIDAIAR